MFLTIIDFSCKATVPLSSGKLIVLVPVGSTTLKVVWFALSVAPSNLIPAPVLSWKLKPSVSILANLAVLSLKSILPPSAFNSISPAEFNNISLDASVELIELDLTT